MADPGQKIDERLDALMQRSASGDTEAFAQAAKLATQTLKTLQQIKTPEAEAMREKLENYLEHLRTAGSGGGATARDSSDVQQEEIHRRVLAGDVAALEKAALTTFGQGTLEWGGRKMDGTLGIVFQCCVLFIEETGGMKTLHILARAGEVRKVTRKGLLSKKTVLVKTDGSEMGFSINRKKSSVDEARRHDNLPTLWTGLNL